jgi:uncharacterized protein YggE
MRRVAVLVLILLAPAACRGQVSGNVAYAQGGGKARAEQNERSKRTLTSQDLPPSRNSTFVEANVLMNVKADEYVVVFAVAREGETLAECSRKVDETLRAFTADLKELGIGGDEIAVDFIAQERIYGYETTGEVAREKLVGYELKKTASIRYKDRDMLDRIVLAAARAEIHDLVKVDYLVSDPGRVRQRLMEEAGRVIKEKARRYETLLDITLRPPGQIYAERPAAYYPTALYDSYTAFESEQVAGPDRQRFAIQSARKSRSFFYNGLDAGEFDAVVNPVILEPVVQFTLYLKVKYEVAPAPAK